MGASEKRTAYPPKINIKSIIANQTKTKTKMNKIGEDVKYYRYADGSVLRIG